MGGPGDNVDAGFVESEVENALPRPALLTPDENFAVVPGRCEDVSVFRVGPRDTPYCAVVAILGEGDV